MEQRSLLGPFRSYEENEVLQIRTKVTTPIFFEKLSKGTALGANVINILWPYVYDWIKKASVETCIQKTKELILVKK